MTGEQYRNATEPSALQHHKLGKLIMKESAGILSPETLSNENDLERPINSCDASNREE